jgi:hypothetical protein
VLLALAIMVSHDPRRRPRGPVWRRPRRPRFSSPFTPPPPVPRRFPDNLNLLALAAGDDRHPRSIQLLLRQSGSRLQASRNGREPRLDEREEAKDGCSDGDPLGGLDEREGPADGSKTVPKRMKCKSFQ